MYPSWTRIGVRDVTKAIEWYQAVTGMRLIERDPDDRFAVLALKVNHSDDDSLWVLERLPENASTDPRSGQVQPVCWIESRDDFFRTIKTYSASVSNVQRRWIPCPGNGEFPFFTILTEIALMSAVCKETVSAAGVPSGRREFFPHGIQNVLDSMIKRVSKKRGTSEKCSFK